MPRGYLGEGWALLELTDAYVAASEADRGEI